MPRPTGERAHDHFNEAIANVGRPEGQASFLKHKTLSAYYPAIQTLRSYLLSSATPVGGSQLESDADPDAYKELLKDCLVASHQLDAIPSRSASADNGRAANLSQQEAIDRVLGDVSRNDDGRNVLLFGLKASYFNGELPINTNRPAFENRHANSPSAILRSLEWRLLRARVGDSAFRDVMVYHSLFVPVGNHCYVQISGTPIFDLYDRQKTKASMEAGLASNKRSREGAAVSGRRAGKRQKRARDYSAGDNAEQRTTHDESPVEAPRGASVKAAADRLILRGRMFYGHPKKDKMGRVHPGLPIHHPLNKLQPRSEPVASNTACLALLRDIFPTSINLDEDAFLLERKRKRNRTGNSGDPPNASAGHRRPGGMIGFARELLARHREIDYAALLRRCQARKAGQNDWLEAITQRSVYRFIAQIIKKLLPISIIGSEHNRVVLLSHIRYFIEMRQHEVVSLHTVMQDMRVNDISWLRGLSAQRVSPGQARRTRALVKDLVSWIFSDLLIPLLRNTFYITETAATRYETVYFLHEDWDEATKPHLRNLEVDLLEQLSLDQAYFAKQGPLGVSAVRLVPKPNGFRPIVNLGKRLNGKITAGIPIFGSGKTLTANQVLRGVHQVLTYEKDRHRHEMGCTLFGTNEVFGPLQALKQQLLARYGQMPRLYFVKMDIKSAFDTIKQDKMLDIVADLLDKNEDYCLMLYSLLLPPASKASQGSARRLFKMKAIVNDGQAAGFGHHAQIIAQPLRNAVIVDMTRRRHITKEDCLSLLRTHIQQNVWEVDEKLFRQKTGIPQGSKISSLLCSFFYAVLERDHLSFVNQAGSSLLRYIDDFLFITDDLPLARRFVQRMSDGFPEFGAFVAQGKTLLSFEFASGSQVAPICLGRDGKEYFPYCGFLIDTTTLDMSMDYARAVGSHIKQSFALRMHRHRGSAFVGWFSRQLENRNHIAYLDTRHNDIKTVRLNVFLNFALTTMKVPHYFRITNHERLSRHRAELIAVDDIKESLCAAAEYTYVAGRARVKHASRGDGAKEHYAISQRDFTRIALSAMIKVLTCKAAQFKEVVDNLTRRLEKQRGHFQLKEAEWLDAVVQEGWHPIKDAKF